MPELRVWTVDEIKALPEFGSDNEGGWFYGLIEDTYLDDEGRDAVLFVLGEIFPGMGYTVVDRDDLRDGVDASAVLAGLLAPESTQRSQREDGAS